MSYPENPNTIIVKNKFYPDGLKQIDIWNHYQLYKSRILNEIRNRNIMLALMIETNKPIMKRNVPKLTNNNYDNIISGRTITLYSTMDRYEDIGIIDLDAPTFEKSKEMVYNVYKVMEDFPFSDDLLIKYTGKTGFHIIVKLKRKNKIDIIRYMIENYLNKEKSLFQYTIGHKRKGNIPNIDISPNKFKGAFTTTGSLSIIGLKCMEVQYDRLSLFNPGHARVKIH